MQYLKIVSVIFASSCLVFLSTINTLSAEELIPPTLLDFSQTDATLTPQLTVNNQPATVGQQWIASDKINLSAQLKVAQADIGKEGSVYVVMLWNNSIFLMKDNKGNWLPWNGDFKQLVAYFTQTLPEQATPVEIISGLGGLTGQFAVYVGYQNNQTRNAIYYNASPITFTVQSIQEVMTTSLHGTTRGMSHFYGVDQGGLEQFTHLPYDDLTCNSCHVDSTACTSCHAVPGDTPDNAKCLDSCHRRQKFEQQFSPDYHLLAQASGGLEMKCASCHTAKQMHGDGQPYSSLHNNPTKVDCQQSGCHTNLAIAGKTMHETHLQNLECAACHVKMTMTCYSCHFADGSGFQPPITDWKILVKQASTGKITTGNIQTMVSAGNSFLVVAPFFGHTVQKNNELTCATCHDSPAVREYKQQGSMTLATWNETDKTIKNLTGVIPIPLDWQTALKVDFVAKDTSGEWTFQKDSIDATQMLFADPINVKKMPKF
ncbi:hypothetical protein THII_1437 [Thioploca ingrica]|uniref:Uncharacterized protein n=1 Tax=Thioploca ingrica TaxID=40754 RepID=A0A090AFA3_9GAMM|nr:hypothetical protein THII_1437 [Thioploca ingrica]